MKSIRFYAALWSAKAAQSAMKLLKRNATYLPGKMALAVCPDFLSQVGKPETLIGVTGTNGKTTVSNMLCDILESWGEDPVSNRFGSNINAGVASSLIAAASLSGRCRKRIGVLEMDERSAVHIFPTTKPDWLVVTNLFRDSMRRNAHPEYIASLLEGNIVPSTRLILNADDPISSGIAPLNSRVYFGMDPLPTEPPLRENLVHDVRICPVCGDKAVYSFRRYHHIGRAACPGCGWQSPKPDFELVSVDPDKGKMTIMEDSVWKEYRMPSPAVYNLYNALTVVTLLRSMGYPAEKIAAAMESLKVVESRFRDETIGRWRLTASMAKGLNSVACSRNFDTVLNAQGKRAVVLMLDDVFDEKESTENIAWLYDADFEFLHDPDIVQVVAVGARHADTKLRLLMAGVEPEKITSVPNAADAAAAVRLNDCERVFVLFEVYRHDQAMTVRNAIAERMRHE